MRVPWGHFPLPLLIVNLKCLCFNKKLYYFNIQLKKCYKWRRSEKLKKSKTSVHNRNLQAGLIIFWFNDMIFRGSTWIPYLFPFKYLNTMHNKPSKLIIYHRSVDFLFLSVRQMLFYPNEVITPRPFVGVVWTSSVVSSLQRCWPAVRSAWAAVSFTRRIWASVIPSLDML